METLEINPKGQVETKIGDVVVYVDEKGQDHQALILAAWPGEYGSMYPGLNLVMADPDENKHDQYGRQIWRESSVPHKDDQKAPGKYWRAQ